MQGTPWRCERSVEQKLSGTGEIRFKGKVIRMMTMVCGGSGVAPMVQIIRACVKRPYIDNIVGIKLVYAAERREDLTFHDMIQELCGAQPSKVLVHCVLHPAGLERRCWLRG